MERENQIEELLMELDLPQVREDSHRTRLKNQLMNEASAQGRPTFFWKKRLAWACCIILLVTATAWAAQKFYKTYIVDENVKVPLFKATATSDKVTVRTFYSSARGATSYSLNARTFGPNPGLPSNASALPTGTPAVFSANPEHFAFIGKQNQQSYTLFVYSNDQLTTVTVNSDGTTTPVTIRRNNTKWNSEDPLFNDEQGRQQYREMMNLAAEEKWRLLETTKGKDGGKTYVYQFTLQGGTEIEYSSPFDPASLKKKGEFIRFGEEAIPLLMKVEKGADGCLLATYEMFRLMGEVFYRAPFHTKINEQLGSISVNRVQARVKWEDDPYHEIPKLIKQGRGVLLEQKKLVDGRTLFIHEFTLSNGEKVKYGSINKPLIPRKATGGK